MTCLYEHWVANEPIGTEYMDIGAKTEHEMLMAKFHKGRPKPSEKYSSLELKRMGLVGLYRKPQVRHTPGLHEPTIDVPGLPRYTISEFLAFTDKEELKLAQSLVDDSGV